MANDGGWDRERVWWGGVGVEVGRRHLSHTHGRAGGGWQSIRAGEKGGEHCLKLMSKENKTGGQCPP